jgi:uncharacterized protein
MPRVVHFEIPADDMQRAVAFYREVFGWQITPYEGAPEYFLVITGPDSEPGINGGIMQRRDGGPTTNTISVDDVDRCVRMAVERGGRVIMPKSPVAGVGYLAYCLDSEGNIFGMMQTDPQAK